MIGITLGEAYGIGSELVVKSLNMISKHAHVIYGDLSRIQAICKQHHIDLPKNLNIKNMTCKAKTKDDLRHRAQYVLDQLETAIEDTKQEKTHALLTCPIDKKVMTCIDPNFDGHTGYLQRETQSDMALMVMKNNDFNIVVGTQHIPLRKVALTFNALYFEKLLTGLLPAFKKHFHIERPRIAVLGINPHAGEIDTDAEEKKWLSKSIASFKAQGLDIAGPFPADSFFPIAKTQPWDIVISPYHDQALVAAKYNGLHDVVNITLGLPFLRTSPGHGVAYNLYGQYLANPGSFQNAFDVIVNGLS